MTPATTAMSSAMTAMPTYVYLASASIGADSKTGSDSPTIVRTEK